MPLGMQVSSSRFLVMFDGNARGPMGAESAPAVGTTFKQQPPILMSPNRRDSTDTWQKFLEARFVMPTVAILGQPKVC